MKNNLRFTKIEIENWMNFSKAEVEFENRAFFIGPNASGKSNFLDGFRFLSELTAIGGGFQEAVRRRGSVSELRCLAARRDPNISLTATLGTDSTLDRWKYRIVFNQDKQRNVFLKEETVYKQGKIIVNRPDPSDQDDLARLSQTYLEQINANQEFREIADFFKSIRYSHIVPQLIRDPDRSTGHANDPYGGDFLERITQTSKKTQEARLNRIRKALQIAIPQIKELEMDRDHRGTPHIKGKYEHWRPQDAWQNESSFSDGTLRLMGLLWALLDGNGPLLLEEPELSLHPEIVKKIPQLFHKAQKATGRQIFVSTHSADLLNDPGIGLNEVFVLLPKESGTDVYSVKDKQEISDLLKGGLTMSEAVFPKTTPQEVEQLTFF